jgi:GWxTD domain-containing protein
MKSLREPLKAYRRGTIATRNLISVVLILVTATTLSLGNATATLGGQAKQKQVGRYKEWLERDVLYLITRQERDAFLRLTSDDARDKFIERFWEIHNPTPGTPASQYKEEHYKRLAYATEHFGKESGNQGWRTDMGRTYIVLGPPNQKRNYHDSQSIRPMEVWFYSNSEQALPPFFSIAFYREDNFSEYKYYSPYFDGPEKLVTTRGNTRLQAWQTIEQDGGAELGRIALSLMPDEPVDTQNATSSMQSDMMLSVLRDLANSPITIRALNLRQAAAGVSASLISTSEVMGLLAIPLRDSAGLTRADYLLRFTRPEDFSIAQLPGNKFYFQIAVRAQVFNSDNRLLFTQERTYTKNLSKDQVDRVADRVFGFGGSLPLPPGTYHVEFQLTDQVKKVSYRAKQDVTVPPIPTKGFTVTAIVPFSGAKGIEEGDPGNVPFSFGGVKFDPMLKQETSFTAGSQINFFYQIWAAPNSWPAGGEDQKLKLSYSYGRPGARQDSQTIDDDVSKSQFDAHGSLVNGKEITVGEWPSGNYRLVMTLGDPGAEAKAYATMNFRVLPSPGLHRPWGIDDHKETTQEAASGVLDYERGQCYLAQGQVQSAVELFLQALQKNPNSQQAITALVDAEYARQGYGEVVKHAKALQLTELTEERTILRMAESLDRTGATKNAIELLESALALKPKSGALNITLSEYYQRSGDTKKSEEYKGRGQKLMRESTATPPA